MKIKPKTAKWISVLSMVLLAASTITFPIDLKSMLPTWVHNPIIGQFSLINIAAYLVLFSAYLVLTKQTE